MRSVIGHFSYLLATSTSALPLDEILRAEWVARVSALDLYIHELVAQRMLDIYDGTKPTTRQFLEFKVSVETLNRARFSSILTDARSAFELDIRTTLSRITFQDPDAIADGVRNVSTVELWNELAIIIKGATLSNKSSLAKLIKRELSLIVSRRNKIAHEGDLQPSPPRKPWPIHQSDLFIVTNCIETIVYEIDSIV
jgi:hypothetical protein